MNTNSQATSQSLITFALVDAETNRIVNGFENLNSINELNINELNLDKYSLIAQINPNHPDSDSVKSVKFQSSQGNRTENVEPYALFGDTDSNFRGKVLSPGDLDVKATAYSRLNGNGEVLGHQEMNLAIVESSHSGVPDQLPVPTPQPAPNPVGGTDTDTDGTGAENPFQDSFMNRFDHVISHFDGNNNDRDDIAALPMAAAITYAAGFQAKSTFFYNNNLGEPSLPMRVEMMRESAALAEKLGITTHDYQADLDGTTAELVKILDSGQKVLAIEGGPMEAIYRALEQVKPQNRQNITLLSHSSWNENRDVARVEGANDVHTWSDIRSDFPEVTLTEIRDQNGGFNNYQWSWLDNTNDSVLQEVRELMKNAANKVNDPSDAGMHFYAITGQENADPLDAQTFFEQYAPADSPLPPIDASPSPILSPQPTPINADNSGADEGQGSDAGGNEPLFTLALVDPATDEVVEGYEDITANRSINLKELDLEKFNVMARTNPNHPRASDIESVKFVSDWGEQVENVKPYALFGDKSGNFDGKSPTAGDYTLRAYAYSQDRAQGKLLDSVTQTISIANNSTTDAGNSGDPDQSPMPAPNPVPSPNPNPISNPEPTPRPPADNGNLVFAAQNGTLVMEAESVRPVGDWKPVTVDGEQGMLWDAGGSSYGKLPSGQTLSYNFQTDEDGDYSIALHSARMKSVMNNVDRYENGSGGKERSDTGNDVYITVVNAETGAVVQSPTKLYTGLGGSDQELRWGTTFDQNHKKSAAKVKLEAGTPYQLEITGRSDGYVLDRITLSNNGFLRDANAPESASQGSAPTPLPNPSPSPGPAPTPSPTPGPKAPFQDSWMNQFDHIISHFDGNNNDYDDIGALPMAAAITYAAGFQNKSTFFYSNNLGEPSSSSREQLMRKSAAFAEKVGITTHDYQADINGTTAELVKILDSGQKILAIEGGPMEAIYRALTKVKPQNRQNITLLSHSTWNETQDKSSKPGVNEVRNWQDIRKDFPEVKTVEIRDQNGGFNNDRWSWLNNTDDPLLSEVRDLMKNASHKVNDPSDAGMHFYAITGDAYGNPEKARDFFEEYMPDGVPTPPLDIDPISSPNPVPIINPQPYPDGVPGDSAGSPGQSGDRPLFTLALVNADTNKVVEGYENLAATNQVNLNNLDLQKFNLVALVNAQHPDAEDIQSVKFVSDLGNQVENVEPFALFGDTRGNFKGEAIAPGNHTVKAIAYSQKSGSGNVLESQELSYSVIEAGNSVTPEPISSPEPTPIRDTNPPPISGGAEPLNSIEKIVGDSTLPHEAKPSGVPSHWEWYDGPRINLGNDPGDWTAITAWGQVYADAAGNPVDNTRVHIKNLQTFVLSKSTGEWDLVQDHPGVDGSAFREDFKGNASIDADVRNEPDGGVSVKLQSGYNYHFWPKGGRASIDPDDIGGVLVKVDARLVVDDPNRPDDRDQARLMMGVGGDYWLNKTARWNDFKTNGGFGLGRFRFVDSEWDAFNISTMTEAQLRQNPPPIPLVDVDPGTGSQLNSISSDSGLDIDQIGGDDLGTDSEFDSGTDVGSNSNSNSSPDTSNPQTDPDIDPGNSAPDSDQPASDSLFKFALVNAETNEVFEGYEDLSMVSSVNLKALDSQRFNLKAMVNADHPDADDIESVKFESGLGDRIENVEPYALFGDRDGNFLGQSAKTGEHTVKATAYSRKNGNGTQLETETLSFSMTDSLTGMSVQTQLAGDADIADPLTNYANTPAGLVDSDLATPSAGNNYQLIEETSFAVVPLTNTEPMGSIEANNQDETDPFGDHSTAELFGQTASIDDAVKPLAVV